MPMVVLPNGDFSPRDPSPRGLIPRVAALIWAGARARSDGGNPFLTTGLWSPLLSRNSRCDRKTARSIAVQLFG